MKGRNERYHDRIAPIYDDVYGGAYWRFYRELTWRTIQPHLPRAAGAAVADLGCGTGEWGLRCLASGYRVTFVDLSNEMICRARERVSQEYPGKETVFVRADVADLSELESSKFSLVIAEGDPLSFTEDPRRAAREIARILAPGGVAVCSVDNRCAAYEPYLERGDWKGLDELHERGTTVWLARDRSERFPTHAFLPGELQKIFERAGLECLDLVGKTALDVRRHADALEDPQVYRRLLAIELECRREPAFLGRAGHLEIVARKPAR